MRNLYHLLVLAFLLPAIAEAQITIQSADLPSAGDTFRVSTAAPTAGIDLTTTGANAVWDFSQLVSNGQTIDTFLSVNATASVFSVVFSDLPFNPNRANQATRGQAFNLGTVNVSDVFNFFYNSSTQYKQPGFGATVNGAQLPIIYSSHDVHYEFPLSFGNTAASNSGYELDLTSTLGFFFQVDRNRQTVVDGWGSVTTPHGTYNALRVVSTIVEQDSVYIDSLGFGLNLPAVTTVEYKWLANGEGIPVLQINTTATGTVTQIRYKDAPLTTGVQSLNPISDLTAYPNPASNILTVRWNAANAAPVSLELRDLQGRIVFSNQLHGVAGTNIRVVDLASLHLAEGPYLLRLNDRVTNIQVRD